MYSVSHLLLSFSKIQIQYYYIIYLQAQKQGSSWAQTVGKSDFSLQENYGEVIAQSYGIFCQFRSKLAIPNTFASKWKENYDAVVVDCHHSLRMCGDKMKMSLSKKIFFSLLGRLPLLPGSNLGQNFRP